MERRPKNLKLIGCGRNRAVWRHGAFVVKVPTNDYGNLDNWMEYEHYRKHGTKPDINGICYPRCRPMPNGWLVMEYVETIMTYREAPEWASYVDCGQVGRGRDGRVVAYDTGY